MAVRVPCYCPHDENGAQRHARECPNRKRGHNKGPQPKEYMERAREPRTYSHARVAVEQLRSDLVKLRDWNRLGNPAMMEWIASASLQADTIRRYLDGE